MGCRRSLLVSLVAAGLLLIGCGTAADDQAASSGPATPSPTSVTRSVVPLPDGPIVVGSAYFAESRMVAEIYAPVLEEAGLTVERDYGIGARELYLAELDSGDVDIVPEYIGSLTENLNRIASGPDARERATGDVEATMAALRHLLAPYGGVVTDPSAAENQNAFAVRADYAGGHDLQAISDLATLNGTTVGGGPVTCQTNPKCLPGLQETYGMEFKRLVRLDTAGPRTLDALKDGTIDVGLVFSSDGTVAKRGFVVLEDDKELLVAENVTALMTARTAAPEVIAALDAANAELATPALRGMNRRVQLQGLPARFVAASWAADAGLVPAEVVPPRPTPTPVAEPEAESLVAPPPAESPGFDRNMGEPSATARFLDWDALAACESGGIPTIISSNGLCHGLHQFSVSTWQAVGGSGAASSASAEEQRYRAQILYDVAGRGSWPSCGVNL
ncbi:MAG: glycine betaine ABC transporter substrate-binding protein [Jiangellales bacterium]